MFHLICKSALSIAELEREAPGPKPPVSLRCPLALFSEPVPLRFELAALLLGLLQALLQITQFAS